jgi:hypothetical protein
LGDEVMMVFASGGAGRSRVLMGARRRRLSSVALPASAEAIVIGGGSIGSSVLYHLAKDHGINAVLLESNQLTSGTTWHSAGLLWQLAGLLGSGDVDVQLSQYTKQLVEETLPAESGEWAGWTTTGSLFACSSEERLVAHNRTRLLAMGIADVESHVLSPQEAKKVHPLMNVDDLVGAIYTPSDGTAPLLHLCLSTDRYSAYLMVAGTCCDGGQGILIQARSCQLTRPAPRSSGRASTKACLLLALSRLTAL